MSPAQNGLTPVACTVELKANSIAGRSAAQSVPSALTNTLSDSSVVWFRCSMSPSDRACHMVPSRLIQNFPFRAMSDVSHVQHESEGFLGLDISFTLCRLRAGLSRQKSDRRSVRSSFLIPSKSDSSIVTSTCQVTARVCHLSLDGHVVWQARRGHSQKGLVSHKTLLFQRPMLTLPAHAAVSVTH